MNDNYLQLVERIAKASGLETGEIERKVEGKRAKLSGLVSKEGAAQIVAAELGINFDKERMKISEIVSGMKRVNVIGKIINISPVRTFSKNGREGKVCNIVLADESSNIKLVLWDTNHISLFENNTFKLGDVIEVSNGQMRTGEIHLSSFGDIKLSNEKLNVVVSERVFNTVKLLDAKSGQSLKVRAVIVQVFDPRYFEVCPECGKRALEGECKVHGKIEPRKRALLNVVLDDGSETIRSVLFNEGISLLGFTDEEVYSLEKFLEKKNSILGEEKYFYGAVRTNALYNTTELSIEKVEPVDPTILITELEQTIAKKS